jgi:hypothetical protein
LESYDSTRTESDYTTDTNVFFLNLNWDASPKWAFFLESVYSLSKGSYAAWGDLTPTDIPADAPISPDNPASTASYDFSMVNEYSDLDYQQLEGTLGINYKLDKNAKVYGSVNLMDLQDSQAYVYGDLTGAIVTYAAGMTVGF